MAVLFISRMYCYCSISEDRLGTGGHYFKTSVSVSKFVCYLVELAVFVLMLDFEV